MKILNLIFIFILSLSFLSCSGLQKREVVEVKVPVIQPWPEPPKIARPDLEINYLSGSDLKNNNYDKIIKALQITNQQLINYAEALEKTLDVYRKK